MIATGNLRPGALRAAGILTLGAILAACSSSGGGSKPARSEAATIANVTITGGNGCELDSRTFAAGGITFKITNKDATAVTEVELLDGERIIGEKENLPPGLSGQFAVSVHAGRYTLYCPGAKTERSTITVTGKAAAPDQDVAALLATASTQYKTYVDEQVGHLVTAVATLSAALHGADLAAAQQAYVLARPCYERIEPVAESFVNGSDNLDADIDARENDVPAARWRGFHKIEKGLFASRKLAGLSPVGDRLVADVKTLQAKTKELTYQPPELANGALELLDEVASTKVTGEEERYSHIDILDMANNVGGAQRAFAALQPALAKVDPGLAATIATKFSLLTAEIDTHRTSATSSGYEPYFLLTDADRRSLSAAVKAVAEPLSQVASKVVGG